MFKKVICVLLVLFALVSCASKTEVVNIPEYQKYDPQEFYAKLDTFKLEAKNGHSLKVMKLYDELLEEFKEIEDSYCIASVHSDIETDNVEYNDAVLDSYQLCIEIEDKFASALHEVALSDCGNDLKQKIDNDKIYERIIDYVDKTDELKDLYKKENELVETYESLDPDGEDFEDKTGQIYIELVPIRDKIAKLEGYKNYNEYCDKEIYGRDYNGEQLKSFYEVSKKYAYLGRAMYLYCYDYLPECNFDADEFVHEFKKCIKGISKLADEAYVYMVDNDLCYCTDSSNSLNVAYTTQFYTNSAPYIYVHTYDNAKIFADLTHEFGHFTNMKNDPEPYPIFATGSYDIFEIHSTGLQLLANKNYTKVVNDKNQMLSCFNVADLISYVTDGCIYDEWQRHIYENPDMNLEEINQWYHDLMLEYGYGEDEIYDTNWMYINHNISSPMYYISYATSGFASLQIWLQSLNNYNKAVKTWEDIVLIGGYNIGYLELMKKANLASFEDSKAVENTLQTATDYCLGIINRQ